MNVLQIVERIQTAKQSNDEAERVHLLQEIEQYLNRFLREEVQHDGRKDTAPQRRTLVKLIERNPHIIRMVSTVLDSSHLIPFNDHILHNCFTILQHLFILAERSDSSGSTSSSATAQWRSMTLQLCLNQFQSAECLPYVDERARTEKSLYLSSVNQQMQLLNFSLMKNSDLEQVASSCVSLISSYVQSDYGTQRQAIATFVRSFLKHLNYSSVPPALMDALMLPMGSARVFDAIFPAEDRASFYCTIDTFLLSELKSLLSDVITNPDQHSINYATNMFHSNDLSNSRLDALVHSLCRDITSWYRINRKLQKLYEQSRSELAFRLYKLIGRNVYTQIAMNNPTQFNQFCQFAPDIFRTISEMKPRLTLSFNDLQALMKEIFTLLNNSSSLGRRQVWYQLQCFDWLDFCCIRYLVSLAEKQREKTNAAIELSDMNEDYRLALRFTCFINLRVYQEKFEHFVQDHEHSIVQGLHHLPQIYAELKTRATEPAKFFNKMLHFMYAPSRAELLSLHMIYRFSLTWFMLCNEPALPAIVDKMTKHKISNGLPQVETSPQILQPYISDVLSYLKVLKNA